MRSCLVVLALVLGCSHPRPSGPAPRGMIAGVVRDSLSGAGIAEAVITLRRPGELAPVSERTTGDGTYMIPDLPAGTYQVTAYVAARLVGERAAEVRGGEVIGLDFAVAPPGLDVPDPSAPGAPTLWRFRPAGADPDRGVIEGTVADALRQRRVADAVVSVTRTGTIDTVQTITDDRGRFRVELPPGTYEVSAYYTVLQRGQLEIKRSQVELAGGETVIVPLWLETDPL